MQTDHVAFVCSTATDDSAGIHTICLNESTGQIKHLSTELVKCPTFLTIHPNGETLYAANRTSTEDGSVSAFCIENDYSLTHIGSRSSQGVGPCYVSIDATAQYILVANYTGGSISALPVKPDGALGSATDTVAHRGSGANPERQTSPHPHSVVPATENGFVYVPDLGTDRVEAYRLNTSSGVLNSISLLSLELPAGSGPRHLVLKQDSESGYLISELNSTLMLLDWDPQSGELSVNDVIRTLPDGVNSEMNRAAAVHIHPNSKWIYASDRGNDSINAFNVHSGKLHRIGHFPIEGKTPREFAFSPSGKQMLVQNRDSSNIVVYNVDQDTGQLTASTSVFNIPNPTCLDFLRI